jgi:uncharacterized membrane protein YwzB
MEQSSPWENPQPSTSQSPDFDSIIKKHHKPQSKKWLLGFFIVGIVLGVISYFWYQDYQKAQSQIQEIINTALYTSPTPVPDPTADWKTFISSDNDFSFKYPGELYFAHIRDDYMLFFISEQEVQDALVCLKRVEAQTGFCNKDELRNMVLNIGVTIQEKSSYTTLKEKYNQLDPKLPILVNFNDTTGRDWTVLGPILIPGASNIEAETTIENKVYHVGVQVGEKGLGRYLERELIPKDAEDLTYQILSTFKFLEPQEKEVSWEAAVEILKNCEVKIASQTHSLDVYLSLKDGSSIHTKEPRIDLIGEEIIKLREKCGEILYATE